MRYLHFAILTGLALSIALSGCGTTTSDATGNGVNGADIASGGDTFGGFGDSAGGDDVASADATTSEDASSGGDAAAGDDASAGDASGGDDTGSGDDAGSGGDSGAVGCKQDADCSNLDPKVCQTAKCDVSTGTCSLVDEVDDATCDDGDPCTTANGLCKSGTCNADAIDCGDGNPCTEDACDASSGCVHTAAAAGQACDDGNACSAQDTCGADGTCSGTVTDCDDSNVCTVDSCDAQTGCINQAAVGACDDGDACTENDACVDGKCAADAVTCNDSNPCTDDTCDSASGCKSTVKAGNCEDGNACTSDDKCDEAGKCQPGGPTDCDDNNACTDDACDANAGCVHTALSDGSQCDDGTACTTGDACSGGKCQGNTLSCDDGEDCTADSCDKATGCVNAPADVVICDDGDACTTGDGCVGGKCVGKPLIDCDDKNPCTTDSCNTTSKGCTNEPNTIACDDGNACTQGDVCADSACKAGTAINCDDNNPCTDDACDKNTGTCSNTNNTAACDDNDACTTKDACADGACAGTLNGCDDGNSCTDDSCDSNTGKCVNAVKEDGVSCDDGSLCTASDSCSGGKCVGAVVSCDDKNPCTDETCDPAKGCVATNNSAKCDDGDACTTGDLCKDGECTASGNVLKCDDGNACTADSCDPKKGCVADLLVGKCDDGDACTGADTCIDGQCVGEKVSCADQNACTTDKCDSSIGCTNTFNTNKCSDGSVCTTGDVCNGKGVCTPGAAIKCDDGNVCTVDSCDAKKGCIYTPMKPGTACDDGNSCTAKDTCDANAKCSGIGKNCDDGNPCTVDSCANNVCASKPAPQGTACNDGNSCSQKDICDGAGKCKGTALVVCDDDNPCTNDVCINGKGCVSTANTATCEDGKWCTEGDFCKDAKCFSGKLKLCDDGNTCTSDLCSDILKACTKLPKIAGTPCSDGNLCTTGDACDKVGTCVAKPVTCNDDNPCTADACNAKTGKCTFTVSTTCPKRKIPDIEEINYLDGNWHLTSSDTAVKWSADNTPNPPGSVNNNASLNFNNGSNYSNGKSVSGSALTKYLYDASAVKGSMTLTFASYNGVENSAVFDERRVEVSTDGFVTTALTIKLPNSAHRDMWWLETVDLSTLAGKTFQVRFRFDSKDSTANTGKGWFVDNVTVYAGPVVKVTSAAAWNDAFAAANSFGWHFSPQYGSNASVWALDKTSSTVGGYTGESLNFNDGVDFNNGSSKAYGWALSPVVDLTGVTSGSVTLLFKSWYDGETSQSYDQRFVEVSSLAFNGDTSDKKIQMQNGSTYQDGWRWEWIDLTAYKGKKVRLRFLFDSVDTATNTGKGWFIDDLRVDNAPLPSFGDMITLANKAAWTFNNAQSVVGWNIDTTGIAPLSKNGSLNFNGYNSATKGYDYLCPTGKSKVSGTATSKPFTVKASTNATATYTLKFDAFVDVETNGNYDITTVLVAPTNPLDLGSIVAYTVPKSALGKWQQFSVDVGKLKGKQATIRFLFDSKDCTNNSKPGVAIENVMVRASK